MALYIEGHGPTNPESRPNGPTNPRALKESAPKSGAPGVRSICQERKVERALFEFEERKLECAPIF